jgi:hypothetical protein
LIQIQGLSRLGTISRPFALVSFENRLQWPTSLERQDFDQHVETLPSQIVAQMSPGKQTSFFNCCAQVSFKKYVALTPDCLQMPRQLPQRDVVMMPVSFVVAVSVALTEALIRVPALVSTEV